ncbi:MAG: hypothetical protein NT030_04075 [Candidatus Saganbacteria bacterium]|nr:hypothetical protein [Candidatus Saganbacteria bacterium]
MILSVLLILGFAYIIWVLAIKESGWVKTKGQVISILIAVAAVIILIYGGVVAVSGKCYRTEPGMMHNMMGAPEKDRHGFMEQMMKDPEMRKMMEEYMKKEGKIK